MPPDNGNSNVNDMVSGCAPSYRRGKGDARARAVQRKKNSVQKALEEAGAVQKTVRGVFCFCFFAFLSSFVLFSSSPPTLRLDLEEVRLSFIPLIEQEAERSEVAKTLNPLLIERAERANKCSPLLLLLLLLLFLLPSSFAPLSSTFCSLENKRLKKKLTLSPIDKTHKKKPTNNNKQKKNPPGLRLRYRRRRNRGRARAALLPRRHHRRLQGLRRPQLGDALRVRRVQGPERRALCDRSHGDGGRGVPSASLEVEDGDRPCQQGVPPEVRRGACAVCQDDLRRQHRPQGLCLGRARLLRAALWPRLEAEAVGRWEWRERRWQRRGRRDEDRVCGV